MNALGAKEHGYLVEAKVLNFLSAAGCRLADQNFSCRFGEIDLIMFDKTTLAFIEVRFRANSSLVNGAASVTPAKQRKIIKSANFYLQTHRVYQQYFCRFDVVSVAKTRQHYTFDWIKDAFQMSNSP